MSQINSCGVALRRMVGICSVRNWRRQFREEGRIGSKRSNIVSGNGICVDLPWNPFVCISWTMGSFSLLTPLLSLSPSACFPCISLSLSPSFPLSLSFSLCLSLTAIHLPSMWSYFWGSIQCLRWIHRKKTHRFVSGSTSTCLLRAEGDPSVIVRQSYLDGAQSQLSMWGWRSRWHRDASTALW